MSLTTRKELIGSVAPGYRRATGRQKGRILDEFVAATGYARKHAIAVLGRGDTAGPPSCRRRKRRYDDAVLAALVALWRAANGICAKRLVPFLPELVEALERGGHLSLAPDVRDRLLAMSIATADRLLAPERRKDGRGVGTTRPGPLLKRQITVRTFADAYLRRLGRRSARLLGDRPGRPLRPVGRRLVPEHPGADRRGDGVDRVPPAAPPQ
ncbi:MAG: hypothetical protein JO250_20625 [Armatimonadetes bacterium]|nr:hypothetical protein [Armatimonadota bacterium]